MITYPLDLPIVPSSYALQHVSVNQINENPFTLQQTVVRGLGDAWALNLTFPSIPRIDSNYNAKVNAIQSFLAALKGRYGTFKFYPANNDVSYNITGNPEISLLSIDNDVGDSITINNQAGNSFRFGAQGSYATIGTQLIRVVSASYSGTSASLEIFPALRSNFEVGTVIEYKRPYGIFRSKNPSLQLIRGEDHVYSFSLEASEAS